VRPMLYSESVVQGRIFEERFVGGDLDQRRQTLRPLPAQGHDRGGLGRRHRPLGPRRDGWEAPVLICYVRALPTPGEHLERQHPPHEFSLPGNVLLAVDLVEVRVDGPFLPTR